MPAVEPNPDATPTAVRKPLWRVLARGCFLGLFLAVLVEAIHIARNNFHVVVPGRIYRCAQPTADELERLIDEQGIRTVVNLRGCGVPNDWYLDECRTTLRHSVTQEDICLSAGRLPAVTEVRRLVEVIERGDYPLLFHCYRGADRTGLASAVALLLTTDTNFEEGRRQLSPRYAHLPLGRPANLDRFFDLYSEWLTGGGLTHSRAVFRRWLTEEYCPGECRARVELLDEVNGPVPVPLGSPYPLRVRCYNTSVKVWHLRAGSKAGIHAYAKVYDGLGRGVAAGRAGQFDAEVPPGTWVDLTLVLPTFVVPGRYRLVVDLTDEQHADFFQVGSEPLERELQAGD
jgi:hypothetical protein